MMHPKVTVRATKKRKPNVRRKDMRPFLSLIAQDGRPLKLVLDSDQEFDILSNGVSHHISISYIAVEKK